MTLLFFDGFYNANTMPLKAGWTWTTTPNNQTGRDGSTNGAIQTTQGFNGLSLTLPTPAATCIAGVGARWTAIDTNAAILGFALTSAVDGTTNQVSLTLNSSGRLQLKKGVWNSATTMGTGTTAIAANTWYYVELKGNLKTDGTGSFEVHLNGALEFTVSGASANVGMAGNVTYINMSPGNTVNVYWDDFYACDAVDATATQGRPFNDFLGDVRVAALIPNGAGASSAWTPSAAGANYTMVDDNPPNTTDYVSSLAGSAQQDLYGLTDLPVSTQTVYALQSVVYAASSDTGTANVKPLLREPDGTVRTSAAQSVSTSWTRRAGDLVTKRSSGSAWSVADVNAAQGGMESA